MLTSAPRLATLCRDLVERTGLTPVGERFHAFEGAGVTGMVLLAESHLAIHTWPELDATTLDVYVCNVSRDNSAQARSLLEGLVSAFAPRGRILTEIDRGAIASGQDTAPVAAGDDGPVLEWLDDDSAFGFRVQRRLAQRDSAHQRIEMVETKPFGTVMRIDGRYMTSERDEFHYHEAMVHPAALSHPSPRRALVIGGGDGGSAEELLKHPSIERIDLVELDADVIELSRRHLPAVHRGALDDPRLRIHIEDGARFVARSRDRYDLAVLDLTDPDTAAARLYDEPFFRRLAAVLAPEGTVSLHVGSPVHAMEQVVDILRRLHAVFPVVCPLATHVPLYGTYWAFAIAGLTRDPRAIDPGELRKRLAARGVHDLRLYHPDLHAALFTLPAYFAERVDFLESSTRRT